MALIPKGAEFYWPAGTAPGIIGSPTHGLVVLTFPGVPSEMQPDVAETAVPFLKAKTPANHLQPDVKVQGVRDQLWLKRLSDFSNPAVALYRS